MKNFIYIILAFVICNVADAALPPLAQEIKEMKALLDDPRFYSYIKNGIIERIEKTQAGYLIITSNAAFEVKVKYAPSQRPGPAQFELIFP